MRKRDVKVGKSVNIGNRNATVEKIAGDRAKVRPIGESSRWIKISDLDKIDERR